MLKIINFQKKLRRRQPGDIGLLIDADVPPLLKRLYIQRGVSTVGELDRSVYSLLTYHNMNGIELATDILVEALEYQRKLMVVGDFDVDGATSTALMVLALKQMGASSVEFIIPNRFKNGYGLSTEIVEQAAARGTKIIVTVDNGISSHDGVNLANHKGIKVLITDHHIPGDKLPTAEVIINPNMCCCNFKSKSLAGVGVAFYLMLSLRARLNKNFWFKKKCILVPNLAELLDLVALGTIADVVPLDKNNRILVYQGINRIRAGYCRPGISALAEVVGIDSARLSTNDLGFYLGPILNAAGRLTDMSLGVTLLLTDNLQQARTIALELDALNHTRRKIEKKMEIDALELCCNIAIKKNKIPCCLVIYHDKWHQGVLGIIASRIKELFNRPVIALSYIGKGLLKGSGRSIYGLHMLDLLERINALYPGIIMQFGGHSMAVGLTLKKKNIVFFRKLLTKIINDLLDPNLLEGVVWSDGELVGQELSCTTVELIRDGGPWGNDFPEPIFDGRFNIKNQKLVGDKHLKLRLKPITGGPLLDGIAFNINSKIWPDSNIHTVELAYKLDIKRFRGNSNLQLLIQHIWPL